MLLRVRVSLPDRPGSLGQVARTLGVAGADIVQVTVLERVAGRAVDDFTVSWPAGAPLDRLRAGLAAVGDCSGSLRGVRRAEPALSDGVRLVGLWRTIGAPVAGGCDAELLGQIATNPADGIATLVDAVPGLLAADWAAAVTVPADWASGAGPPAVACASWRAPDPLGAPDVLPLRARAMTGVDGTAYAAVPFGRAGLVLLVARATPAFHATEVDRLAQLVRASAVILRDRLEVSPAGSA